MGLAFVAVDGSWLTKRNKLYVLTKNNYSFKHVNIRMAKRKSANKLAVPIPSILVFSI